MRFQWPWFFGWVAGVAVVVSGAMARGQVEVKHPVGARHGFLTIRSQGGVNLGYAELSEYAAGDTVTVKMVYHFFDGSQDDETTVFTQGKTFRFVSDHHIQKGRFFKAASDVTVEADGKVTTRTIDKDGKEKVDTEQMDIPPNFANGMVGTVMENIEANATPFQLGMIVPTPKPRAIKLDISPEGEQSFRVAGAVRKAKVFRLKLELGGVVGVIAPLVGKQPKDILISVLEGEVPVVVRIEQQLAEDTPLLDVGLAGASFQRASGEKK
jgi:hypothetical protein